MFPQCKQDLAVILPHYCGQNPQRELLCQVLTMSNADICCRIPHDTVAVSGHFTDDSAIVNIALSFVLDTNAGKQLS
jgi:hypothetical protein